MLITSGQKNTNFVEDVEYVVSCQGSLNSIPDKKSKISQQIRGMAAILIFQSAKKNQKLGRGGCDFASCQVSLNSIQRL